MLGVMMLDTRFPRLPGDVGHPASWRLPVCRAVVRGASPQRVVRERDPALLQPFIAAGLQLVSQGARALTTSCGFLYGLQDALQAALPVPVWSSSLLALSDLPAPGVLTVDAPALRAAALLPPGLPVTGLAPGCHLQQVLMQDLPELDPEQAQADAVAAACALVRRWPQVQQLLLECTNLPPYAAAIAAATGRPVTHLLDLVHERYARDVAPLLR